MNSVSRLTLAVRGRFLFALGCLTVLGFSRLLSLWRSQTLIRPSWMQFVKETLQLSSNCSENTQT